VKFPPKIAQQLHQNSCCRMTKIDRFHVSGASVRQLISLVKESPPVAILALMMFLLPAVGVPSNLMLQDTLKSGIAAFGVLSATFVFFWQRSNRADPLIWHPALWLPIAMMLYALGSMVWSHTYLAAVEAVRWFVFSLLMWLGLNTLTLLNLPRLLWGIHWGAFVASIWVALQFWFDLKFFAQAAAPASTFANRNFYAEYAACVLPLSIYLLASTRDARWREAIAFSVALNVIGILITGTRSALLASGIALPLSIFALIVYRQTLGFPGWTTNQAIRVFGILLLAIGGMASISSGNAEIGVGPSPLTLSSSRSASVAAAIKGEDGSFSVRVEMWKATARMIMAHPWTGVGAGSWEVQIPLYQRIDTGEEIDAYAHNEYLQLLGEYGLPLGGLILAITLAGLINAARHLWVSRSNAYAPAAFIAIGSGSLLLVAGAGFPLRLAACTAFFGLALAIILQSTASARRVNISATANRYFALGIGTSSIIYIGVFVFATYVERMYVLAGQELASALNHPSTRAEKLISAKVHLTRALAAHPHYAKLQKPVAAELIELGEWPMALATMEALVASRPNAPDQWFSLAVLRARTGDFPGSEYAFGRLENLQPNGVRNAKGRIDLHIREGRYDLAETELQLLLAKWPPTVAVDPALTMFSERLQAHKAAKKNAPE
jgi:O-antigen ligase